MKGIHDFGKKKHFYALKALNWDETECNNNSKSCDDIIQYEVVNTRLDLVLVMTWLLDVDPYNAPSDGGFRWGTCWAGLSRCPWVVNRTVSAVSE